MTRDSGKEWKGDPNRLRRVWSISMYRGPSPLKLAPTTKSPVLTAEHVSDVDAHYVADPFILRREQDWFMYFEVLLNPSRVGVIGLATSKNGLDWDYQGIVLEEPFHLSYPHVFEWQGEVYLLPETLKAGCVRLYKSASFPGTFEPVADLIPGAFADPTLFNHEGRWWLFVCAMPFPNRTMHLYFADDLLGPWHRHPQSPIVADDQHIARPGGRVVVLNGRPVRFAQDGVPKYGTQVRALEILELTPENYVERECAESPILRPSKEGWNSVGMHHVDPHQLDDGTWLACVDGDTLQ